MYNCWFDKEWYQIGLKTFAMVVSSDRNGGTVIPDLHYQNDWNKKCKVKPIFFEFNKS